MTHATSYRLVYTRSRRNRERRRGERWTHTLWRRVPLEQQVPKFLILSTLLHLTLIFVCIYLPHFLIVINVLTSASRVSISKITFFFQPVKRFLPLRPVIFFQTSSPPTGDSEVPAKSLNPKRRKNLFSPPFSYISVNK